MEDPGFWWEFVGKVGAPMFAATLVASLLSGEFDPLHGVLDVLGADPNPALLLVIAYAVRRLPYVVRATVAGLEQTSSELEEAALNMGASRTRMVRTIVPDKLTAMTAAPGPSPSGKALSRMASMLASIDSRSVSAASAGAVAESDNSTVTVRRVRTGRRLVA